MLERIGQDDFSAGAFRGVARHLIPPHGVYTAENVLLDDDGSLYKRGGGRALSTAGFGAGLRWVADLHLLAGRRTVIASGSAFGVLDGGEVPVSLGGGGVVRPPVVAVLGGVAYIGGGTIYAGSRKAADYSAGSVAVTKGSRTVTGSGTSFTANVDAGMLLRVGGAGRYYAVESVDSNTQLTLADPFEADTAAGQSYVLSRLGAMGAPYVSSSLYAAAGDRLWAAAGRTLRFSKGRDQDTGALRPHVWDELDFHEMPLGAEILGLVPSRDVLLVFTTGGLLAVSNIYFDMVDAFGNPQQTLEHLSEDLVLWGASGSATWQGAVVAPCVDGLWLLPREGAPAKVSRSIEARWVEHVRAGRLVGQAAVYHGHYLLPVIDSAANVVDLLVCRLDRPTVDGRELEVWPWSWLAGHDAAVSAVSVRVSGLAAAREPLLLGASRSDGARVLDVSGFFEPVAGNRRDSDGSTPRWLVETRDFATGAGNLNTARRMQALYELEDGAAEDPAVLGYVSKGTVVDPGSVWGAFAWGARPWSDAGLAEWMLLPGQAPESAGRDPHTWGMAVRSRFVRGRLESAAPAAKMVLRRIAFFVRLSRKDR